MRVGAALLLLLVGAAACAIPTLAPTPTESAELCPAALLEGELIRDDGTGFLVRYDDGLVVAVLWPDGYTVRDGEVRELLDPQGQVVAREGDFISAGGGMAAGDEAFLVCGRFTVTPAGASSPPNPGIPQPSEEACDAALLEGELLADDATGFLVAHESGAVTRVVWPDGYVVAIADRGLALLDPAGVVVAVEGDFVELGGGMNADETSFVVCGPFTVRPAS
jgi:hypothetical protein